MNKTAPKRVSCLSEDETKLLLPLTKASAMQVNFHHQRQLIVDGPRCCKEAADTISPEALSEATQLWLLRLSNWYSGNVYSNHEHEKTGCRGRGSG
jgi:hypothetical protein